MSDIIRHPAPVAPGGTIGILGGGQLGRMLALAAARLGLKTHIYSDEQDAPAFQVTQYVTRGTYEDRVALAAFARSCNAVTFEFENVPAETLEFVGQITTASPCTRALRTTQDRLSEKEFLTSLGLATPAFFGVSNASEARAAYERLGGRRAILKTRRLGYDGKGQASVASSDEASVAMDSFRGAPAILEAFVEFAFEASVIGARAADGSFAAYDPPENTHGDHILHRSIVPSRMSRVQCDEAISIAKTISEALEFVGVFAVELFVTRDGALLVNEIAPRVHNSGHWTIEACAVSQFEQHIRAVAGWPLGDPARHSDAVMVNIIGNDAANWLEFAARGGALHLYGKSNARQGRKMGHFTTLSPLTRR